MPKIPNLLAFGQHCHNCGKWMQRRALRKDVVCNLCNGKIFARNCKQMQLCSRCVECDNIILDNFNYCECCGLETNRQLRITKARALSNLFPKNQAAPDSSVKSLAASTIQPDKSPDLFDDFQVDNEELTLLEESLVTDDVSSDIENNLTQLQESLLTDVSLEEEKKENILNGWQTTEEADIQTLVTRLTQYHKEGVKFSEEFLEEVMVKATELGLPPHKQLGVLSLSQRTRLQDGDDLFKVARSTVDLFRTEWPDSEYAQNLTEEKLLTAEGRREAFSAFAQRCASRAQQKALVDVLACWPPAAGEGRSLHCVYLGDLLASELDPREALVLIKLLLRRPVLQDEDICWLVENVPSRSVVNTLWVLLLNKCARSEDLLCRLVQEHKETILNISIEDELIKEMLDQGMFIKLVSTPLYTSVVNYIMTTEASSGEPASSYTVGWATAELLKANYLAEAGHLQMMSVGIPSALRGFSQTVQYCKNLLK